VFRFLLAPKWLAVTLVALLLQPAFWELSQWQWRRLHQREQSNSIIVKNQRLDPVALEDLVTVSNSTTTIDASYQWRTVDVVGTWLTDKQVLVRKQSYESNLGFWVLTPFVATSGVQVLVNRGWIPASGSATDSPIVQRPPVGSCELLGRVRLTKDRKSDKPTDLPTGQVDGIQPDEVLDGANLVSNAYLELTASTPQALTPDLQPILAPEISEGPHRSYAWQWIFFAIMTLIGWAILVRKELQDRNKTAHD